MVPLKHLYHILTSPEPGDKLQMGYKSIKWTDESASEMSHIDMSTKNVLVTALLTGNAGLQYIFVYFELVCLHARQGAGHSLLAEPHFTIFSSLLKK